MAIERDRPVGRLAQGHPGVIQIDEIWLAREPLDMRAGPDTALARVISSFGEARHHCAYVFANKRANRIKVLVCDGFGIWLASRRLHQGVGFHLKLTQGFHPILTRVMGAQYT